MDRDDVNQLGMPSDTELSDVGLTFAVDGSRATVSINRPESRNSQTPAMWRMMSRVGANIPDSVRVLVVTGEGTTFSAGLDRAMLSPAPGAGVETVADLLTQGDTTISATIDDYQRGFTWLRDPRFVSIAAVQGYAIGAGFQLALSCDLRVVADDVQFSMRESALGLVPDLTGTKPLVEIVGYARALEMCATARFVRAEEAVETGIALAAVPAAELTSTVADLADALTAAPVNAVRETKALLQTAQSCDLDEQRRLEREAQIRCFRELSMRAKPSAP